VLRALPFPEREALLETIAQWAGQLRPTHPENRVLTQNELWNLSCSPYITIGAHTCHHPMLSALSIATQEQEILKSQAQLCIWIEQPLRVFAYPFGWNGTYNADTLRIVRSRFDCACTTYPASVRQDVEKHRVPRYTVRDWDAETFTEHLDIWLNAATKKEVN
jgi:peptidoglycan/xylan/chitin deacetylase (PgdA/CDA1 family)